MSETIYAVLTGDIVNSRELSADHSKKLQQRLKSAAAEFQSVFPGTVVGTLGITRGDGWQVALQKPERALRLALFIRAVVKSEFKWRLGSSLANREFGKGEMGTEGGKGTDYLSII